MTKVYDYKSIRTVKSGMTKKTVAAGIPASEIRRVFCRLHYRSLRTSVNLPGLSEVFSRLESASIIGGNASRADAGRFSYWAAQPKEILQFRPGQYDPFGKLQKAAFQGKFSVAAGSGISAMSLADISKSCRPQLLKMSGCR
jgi:hypothetical protein